MANRKVRKRLKKGTEKEEDPKKQKWIDEINDSMAG